MRIESAVEREHYLELIIDGRHFRAGDKYTILDLGYAVYLMDRNDEDWLRENGDTIPADPSEGRNELKSGQGMLVTGDPVLVALAIESWWSRNGFPKPQNVPLPIPTAYEAFNVVRNRKILNDFNRRWAGYVPGLEIMSNRGRKKHNPAKPNQEIGTDEKIKNYKAELNQRYWEYQKEEFPNWEEYLEKSFAQNGRPPVFLAHEAWRNIIINPKASEQEKVALFGLIPEGEHHKWFRSMNSSQALALSILGNLAVHNSFEYLSDLQDDEGNNLFGSAQITSSNFLMEHRIDYLGEHRHTSLDGYISGGYRVAIECKFTETEVGTCSRPRLTPADPNFGSEFCNGTYSQQWGRDERCPLTGSGVLYWQYIPAFFKFGNDADLDPCPLNKNYQLVRNVLAIGVNENGSVSTEDGHAILIYDERNPAFMKDGHGLISYSEIITALKPPDMLRKCSWQKITDCIRQNKILPWLTDQLAIKYGL